MRKINHLILFLLMFGVLFSEVNIGFWNVLHLGWDQGKYPKDYNQIAETISVFDLVGLVEVMNEDGLIKLTNELELITNENWDYLISKEKYGRSTYKEYYAYVYRKDKICVLLDFEHYDDLNDDFIREPYGVMFSSGNFDFVLVLYHSVFGKNKSERRYEASRLDDVYLYFKEIAGVEKDIIFAGDFNLHLSDKSVDITNIDGFNYLIEKSYNTTSSNSYDNFLVSQYSIQELEGFGVFDVVGLRHNVSDHYLIYASFNTDFDDD